MSRRRWPWVIWAFSVSLAVVGGYLIWSTGGQDPGVEPMNTIQMWVQLVAGVAAVTAGAIILSRYPQHVIGWLMILMGLFTPTSQIATGYAASCSPSDTCNPVVLVLADIFWFPAIAIGLAGLFLLFPHGSIPRGWRRIHLIALVSSAFVGALAALFSPEVYHLAGAINPLAPEGSASEIAFQLNDTAGGVMLLLSVVAIVDFAFRVRRSTGLERVQLRWLMWAGLVTLFGGFLSTIGPDVFEVDLGWAWALGLVAMPVAVTIAITRHGLYEIDRIVSRTISYAIVIGLLVGVVAVPAALVGTRFESPLVVAATTLGVAALFNPLRKHVQAWVDRRFNRSRYDAERVMVEFAGSLREETNAEDVVEGWVDVVSETMEPTAIGVWVRR